MLSIVDRLQQPQQDVSARLCRFGFEEQAVVDRHCVVQHCWSRILDRFESDSIVARSYRCPLLSHISHHLVNVKNGANVRL